jgi:hypothetical protein
MDKSLAGSNKSRDGGKAIKKRFGFSNSNPGQKMGIRIHPAGQGRVTDWELANQLKGTSNNSGSTRYGNQGGSIVCSV